VAGEQRFFADAATFAEPPQALFLLDGTTSTVTELVQPFKAVLIAKHKIMC
jgi:hypothetical protein